MRIFIALDIDEAIRERFALFLEAVREFAPAVRWTRPESLHVTLKFVGEKPPEMVEQVQHVLSAVRTSPFSLTFRSHGFFPNAKSPRVFWIGIDSGRELATLARAIDEGLAALSIPKEDHPFSPHLTLARGGSGSGSPQWRVADRRNNNFQRLQEKMANRPVPEFGTMTAREFFLFRSELGRGGSRYTKIARFALD